MTIRLLIADGHELIRAGLREFLRDTDIEIIGEVTSDDAVAPAAAGADVVLLSPNVVADERLEVIHRTKDQHPQTAVVLFAAHRRPVTIANAIANEGAGLLLKDITRDQLVAAIHSAAEGKTLWSRDELRRAGSANREAAAAIDVQLTPRESEVLVKLVDGLTNKQIAQQLEISYETVKEHVQHILRKVGVTDRTQAAVWAVRHGLV